MINKLKYIIPCILLLLVQLFYTIPVSAYEIVQNVYLANASSNPTISAYSANNYTYCSLNSGIVMGSGNTCDVGSISSNTLNWRITSGQILQITLIYTNLNNNDSSDAVFGGAVVTPITSAGSGPAFTMPTMSVNSGQLNGSSGYYTIRVRADRDFNLYQLMIQRQSPLWLGSLHNGETISFSSIELYSVQGQQSDAGTIHETADVTHRLQEQTNSRITELIEKQSTSNDLARENIAKVEEQTRQQREQYEQDKQEESDRENQMQGAADDAAGLFNFSIRNPLEPIFGAFTAGNCVAIPNLARMVGSTETTYCSWFSSSTRAILTPVISIFSIIILFGFVVKWLNKDDGGGE